MRQQQEPTDKEKERVYEEPSAPVPIPLLLDAKDVARFWSKLDTSGGDAACWPWQGSLNSKGYGSFHVRGKTWLAHRLVYLLSVGPIPDGLFLLHRCDNPACTNPTHLTPGTHRDNMRDMMARHRHAAQRHPTSFAASRRGEKNGRARLTAIDVLFIRKLYRRGGLSHSALARRYRVSKSTIGDLLRGKTWKHLPSFGWQWQPGSKTRDLKETA